MAAPITSYSTASLYVGDLNADVNENMLFEIFNAIGPVTSIRVCRDTVTRRSLGYAYVNFANPADADSAIKQLNFSDIKGRPCRIMISQRDPGLRKSGTGNIFVHNLEKTIDNQQLYDTFADFGRILSSKVQNKDGKSLGYGFVHFEKDESAAKAISTINGMEINGQIVKVELFKPLAERDTGKKSTFTNVYVKNLPASFTTEQLHAMFAPHGEIANVFISVDEQGKSKMFGFVNFARPEDAAVACEALNNVEVEDTTDKTMKKLWVGRALKKSERERQLRESWDQKRQERQKLYVPGTNLYVKNLADDVDDEALRAEFSKFGQIASAKVMRDRESSRLRGFGFVSFATPEEATRAVTEMNGKLLRGKPLYVALAQRRDARRAQLEAQFANSQYQAAGPMPMGPMGPMGYPMGAPPMYFQQRGAPMGGMPPQMIPYGAQGRPAGAPAGRGPFPYPQMMPQGYMQQQQMRGPRGPRPQGAAPQGGKPRSAAAPNAADALSPEVLAAATPEMQKQIIGERLYAQIQATQPAAAAKITGMLLEMDNTELLNLLESPAALNEKVTEALRVLSEHAL
jgi:polyadenylate-binding protein